MSGVATVMLALGLNIGCASARLSEASKRNNMISHLYILFVVLNYFQLS